MITYTTGTPAEYDDLLDFGNYVFKIDFKALLPKLYDHQEHLAPYHFIAKEGNRIKAMVGCFPLDLNVGTHHLKGMGIGTVSVHPYSRRQGFMKHLMTNALDFMQAEQADFAILSGQRQRYEYFGFAPTGVMMRFVVDQVNLAHKSITHTDSFTLRPFDDLTSLELQHISKWHHSKLLFSSRPLENFITICKTWQAQPFAFYQDGVLKGYIIIADTNVLDFYIEETSLLGPLLSLTLSQQNLGGLSLSVGPHDQDLITYLMDFAENYSISTATHLNILNYETFIRTFLALKSSYTSLEKGRLILEIKDVATLLIEIGEQIQVTPTDQAPHISLSHLEATHFLCDPMRFIPEELRDLTALIYSWFPLPFSFCSIDNV
ncbi:MAG: GNAT family N-acetyltransferase [Niameybacter sp.]